MRELTHTPEGVRDLYGDALERQMAAENQILETMEQGGYRLIRTPALEYCDLYTDDTGAKGYSEYFRYFDRNGEILVLRPDFTPSLARSAAKYFLENDAPLRLCYQGSVFNNRRGLQGKLREETQTGAELYNDASVEADVEIIGLAIDSLRASGVKDIRICVGHVDYFYGLCREAKLSADAEAALLDAVCDKNPAAAAQAIEGQEMPESVRAAILSLADCLSDTGNPEVLLSGASNETAKNAVLRLIAIRDALKKQGKEADITFDPGMLNRHRYYTGMVFRAYTYGIGEPIVRGGRYDDLLAKFGHAAPAVGFMIVTDDLSEALAAKKQKTLTLALGKGRLADKTMELLSRSGFGCREMQEKSRKLLFTDEESGLSFFLAKGPDVPTYVEYGAADIGVVGEDTILEEGRRVFEVLDLGFGRCRMCVCGRPEAAELLKHREMIRVATKYPEIARDYFYRVKKQTVELIKLNGSVELGPIVGLSDVIVDIVETGSTLKENGLQILEEICPLSARVIVNPVSMQMKSERIKELITALKKVLAEDAGA